MPITQNISALPTPPSTSDPASFDSRADAFLGALPTFQTQLNSFATDANSTAIDVNIAAQSAVAVNNVVRWQSGTTYTQGQAVYSTINYLTYRRTSASGSGTTDPSLDSANYVQVVGTGNVTSDQVILAQSLMYINNGVI